MSTVNLFDLPVYCQYGIGSPGFGVWREIAAHTLSTNWVLSGESLNFPLMYHWRLVEKQPISLPSPLQLQEVEQGVTLWGTERVRARLEENIKASAEIVLFLEYIPANLHQWLSEEIAKGEEAAESACIMVDRNLYAVTSFMNARGFLHFDAHFMNILTDGQQLYFADFGLAISEQFELSEAEAVFFKQHVNYDQCYTKAYFVEWLLTTLLGAENWFTGKENSVLHEYATGKGKALLPAIDKIIRRDAPIALVMQAFFLQLKKSKLTSYPHDELERISRTIFDSE